MLLLGLPEDFIKLNQWCHSPCLILCALSTIVLLTVLDFVRPQHNIASLGLPEDLIELNPRKGLAL